MPYTLSVEIVPDWHHVVRLPVPAKPLAVTNWQEDGQPNLAAIASTTTVDIPLLPYVCASGVEGYAGWALVGTTLRGFVREGPTAEMVAHDLRARLDYILVGLEQHGQAGLDYARVSERADRERGLARQQERTLSLLAELTR